MRVSVNWEHDDPSGHVFAAVASDTLHNRPATRLSYGEPLPSATGDKQVTARRPVEYELVLGQVDTQ